MTKNEYCLSSRFLMSMSLLDGHTVELWKDEYEGRCSNFRIAIYKDSAPVWAGVIHGENLVADA